MDDKDSDLSDLTGLANLPAELFDAAGNQVASVEDEVSFSGGKASAVAEMKVAEPCLWDTESPYLYTLRSSVVLDGRTVDAVDTKVGIRTIEYDVNRGFLLNGRQVKMKGVNLHHDAGAVGAAVPERGDTQVWRMQCDPHRAQHPQPRVP